jgi:hypothetical protein
MSWIIRIKYTGEDHMAGLTLPNQDDSIDLEDRLWLASDGIRGYMLRKKWALAEFNSYLEAAEYLGRIVMASNIKTEDWLMKVVESPI